MKTAMILGVSGQDGTYLAERLLREGMRVVGTTRSVDGFAQGFPALANCIEVIALDLQDSRTLKRSLERYRPDLVFNLAANSSGAGMFDFPEVMQAVNGTAVLRILESILEVEPRIRFCQASSSEIFGLALESPQSESTGFAPRSPYGHAKLAAHLNVVRFRQEYGLFACSAILFNHESPRRGLGFVTRKISHAVASIKLGLVGDLQVGNLEALRDWGWAEDYVRAMALMLAAEQAEDYVIATGVPHTVRDFCQIAFSHVGLDYRHYVKCSPVHFRPGEPVPLVGDASKAKVKLGWEPSVRFEELVAMMVDADLERLNSSRKLGVLCDIRR